MGIGTRRSGEAGPGTGGPAYKEQDQKEWESREMKTVYSSSEILNLMPRMAVRELENAVSSSR